MATLPQDVFDCAIDDLKDDCRALGTCALVCREWLHRSRVHLFSEVTFHYPIQPSPSSSHTAAANCPTGQLIDHPATHTNVSPESSTVPKGPDRAAEFTSLIDGNPKLADYVHAVTVRADRKRDGAEARWTLLVARHLCLLRFPQLRSLRIVRFAFESLADLIPTVQAILSLDSLSCEEARFLPPPFSPMQPADADPQSSNPSGSGALDLRPEQATSLMTLSLSIASNIAAEQPDTAASARALHSAQAFVQSGLLRLVTSLEICDASTVLAWLPIVKSLGPQLHHVGLALHDVQIPGDIDEALVAHYNVLPSPRDTVVRVFDVLRRCTSLRTLGIRYDAEDTISVRMGLVFLGGGLFGSVETVEEGPLISSYLFDEAVRLFSGTSMPNGVACSMAPCPALQALELRLVTTVHSLQSCASACTALAKLLACHEYPAFGRLGVVVEEPAILGVLFGDREADEAACVRKERALRAGLLRPFEEAGIALEVAVLQRLEES